MSEERIIEVNHLSTEFRMRDRTVYSVNDVSYYVNKGEIVGVVGESGSGKSVTELSVMRIIQSPPGHISAGEVLFDGRDLLKEKKDGEVLRSIRGHKMAMIFQDPMVSLNPTISVGEQISETIRAHLNLSKEEAQKRAIEYMKKVHIPDAESRYHNYPYEFSGGMCQRIIIAMALSCEPQLLIADEATTALDVTTQSQILEMLKDIVESTGTSLIIVTHNLGIVARYANRIYVMYGGRIVESGSVYDIFYRPGHAYTIGLLNSMPRLDDEKDRMLVPIFGTPPNLQERKDRCPFFERCTQRTDKCESGGMPALEEREPGHFSACYNYQLDTSVHKSEITREKVIDYSKPLLEVNNLEKCFPIKSSGFIRRKLGEVHAVNNVSFKVYPGETLGVVGESGCGKSTIANCVLRLLKPTSGTITFDGITISDMKESEFRKLRKRIQMVFQDPFSSLDPKQYIGDIVGEPLKLHKLAKNRDEYNSRVIELFNLVGLDPELRFRAPHELSGGQRQRIGIARALATEPDLIVCDEPVSALDVSVQAQIINLLEDLQKKLGIAYVFIAHDLSVVRHISDRVVVLYMGKVVEQGDWKNLYENPQHPYTKALLSAIPIPDPNVDRSREMNIIEGETPSVSNMPSGCTFHPRCPYATEKCRETVPELHSCGKDHQVACLYPSDYVNRGG